MLHDRSMFPVLFCAAGLLLAVVPTPVFSGEPAEDAFRAAVRSEELGHLEDARYYYGKSLLHAPSAKLTLLRLGVLQSKLGEEESAQLVLGRLERLCEQCDETRQLRDALARNEKRPLEVGVSRGD